MTTLYYFAADLSPVLDINSKLVWREVRKHDINPQMIVNKYGITEKDVVKLERALGVKVPRKRVERRKSKPKAIATQNWYTSQRREKAAISRRLTPCQYCQSAR